MKFKFIDILYLLFVTVIPVYSECDTYFGCIRDSLFGSFINLNITETQVGKVEVPDFDNVNLELDSVDTILKHISNLFEEIVEDSVLSSHINVLHKSNNKTSIFVKTFNTDNFDDIHDINSVHEKEEEANSNTLNYQQSTGENNDITTIAPLQTEMSKSIIKDKTLNKTQNPVLDIIELSKKVKENEILDVDSIDSYYDLNDNSTDYPIIDYIDLYKDTTNEEVNTKTTLSTSELDETVDIQANTVNFNISETNNNRVYTEDCSNTDVDEYIFPWVTAIFIKNQTSNQYDYYCDGALLSNTVIITAASCIEKPNATSDDILVILGKKSLRVMTDTEILSKIKEIHIHDNFTSSEHDIAILVMEEPVTLSDRVQRARLGGDRGKAATTGWAVSGNLTLIMIEDVACKDRLPENTFCAVYGNDVSVCPSYGGVYTMRQTDGWFLRGIRKADPTNKGFCEGRSLVYTDLKHYNDWINVFIQ